MTTPKIHPPLSHLANATAPLRAAILVCCAAALATAPRPAVAQQRTIAEEIDRRLALVMPKVIAWRRDLHEHPELSNRETRTSRIVADHLRSLGLEVREGIARTGVVGVLKGGKPGPVVALRADMDALPVTEEVDLPFRSNVKATFAGQTVGVMHACGHDAHTAMLMGTAEILAGMRAQIPGTVTFIFQPAEEGPPPGELGGASLMVAEGALENPAVDAVFGLHVWPDEAGKISYKAGGAMSAADQLNIVVTGKQTHGAQPWRGVDPIVISAEIVSALQTITARQTDITLAPAVVTVATINGGIRFNIIPDSVVMTGTIRTFDAAMRKDVHMRITRTAEKIAEASGATAVVNIVLGGDVLFNDIALTERMGSTIRRVTNGRVNTNGIWMPSEDFPSYTKKIPGLFVFLGVNKPGISADDAAPNHSPRFFVNEDALPTGVRTMANLAMDYLTGGK
jgi:amidohydrolase